MLKLKHWADDPANPTPQDKNDRFKGRELYSKGRRIVADFMAAKRVVSCVPVDRDVDPRTAETAKFPVEHIVRTPQYGFETYAERMAWSAVAARRGFMVFEWDQRINDLTIRNADPRRVFLCPGYFDTWDRTLPWIMEQIPLRVVDARARWPEADIRQDFSGSDLNNQLGRNDVTNTLSADPQEESDDEGMCLALVCWSQFDDETQEQVVGSRPVQEPYSYCPNCDAKNSPEYAGMACPECLKGDGQASELQLAQSEDFVADLPRFPMGRVLEVVFPLQNKCVQRGGWPTGPNGEQLRMPPYVLLRRTESPNEFCGLSDTAVDAPMQTLSNQLMERVRRQLQGPSNVIGITGSPEDAESNPWQPTDDPIQFAYFPSDPMGPSNIRLISLSDVSPSLFNAIQMVQEQFRADLGTFELSAQSAGDVKGVAVGTVEQAAQSGAVPTDHFIRNGQLVFSHAYGIISDWCRIGWTQKRWVRYRGAMGPQDYKLISGADIPNVDFVFHADKDQEFADREQFNNAMLWWQTGLPPNGSPLLRRALAEAGLAPISLELYDKIESAEADAMDQAASAGGPPMGADAAGAGPPGMTPMGPEAGSPMGNGAAPPMPVAQ